MERSLTKKIIFSVLLALIVAAVVASSIGAVYVFVLPKFFPGPEWGTYSPLILGIILAALIGGYIGYRVPSIGRLSVKISLGFCYAAVVFTLISYLSLFIILNTRGS